MALSVPQPLLEQDGAAGNRLSADKPINLSCGPVTFPDGASLDIEKATRFGFLLYREISGGLTQWWDEAGKAWKPESASPETELLFFMDGKWRSLLVAVGQKDQAGQDKFRTDPITGLPRYFVRCFFRGRDAQGVEHSGESGRSQAVEVYNLREQQRAGLAIEPEEPSQAGHIRLFLKDDMLVERGQVVIRRQGAGFLIELLVSGARLTLDNNGEIVLAPASGQPVRVAGDLSVSTRIFVNGIQLNVP